MKQRVTYIVSEEAAKSGGYDPSNLDIKSEWLTVKKLDASKEYRVTLGLEEVPEEVSP